MNNTIDVIGGRITGALFDQGILSLRVWATGRTADIQNITSNAVGFFQELAIAIIVICIVIILYIVMQKRIARLADVKKSPGNDSAAQNSDSLSSEWAQIRLRLDSSREADCKLAIIEADSFVDDALGKSGFSGANFGDRLMNISPGSLISLDGLWWAHKVRNRIAHEQDYFLRYTEARQAIGYFEQVLKELKLI